MRTSILGWLLVSVIAAACGCSSKAKGGAEPTPAPAPAPTPAPAPAPAPIALDDLGAKCVGEHTCPTGLECVSYYGIAGASGPQLESCEKKCATDTDCPDGSKCRTIADGPGHVCRK